MHAPDLQRERGYYFALPRLVSRFSGGSGARSEQNWREANMVGAAFHLIVYLFAAHLLLSGHAAWLQIALLLPLVFLVLILWMIFFCLSAAFIRLLRSIGVMRAMPTDRAQGLLIGIMTTAFACRLATAGSWLGIAGSLWIAGVVLNVLAAGVLTFIGEAAPPTE